MEAAPLTTDLPGRLVGLADEPLDPAATCLAAVQALRDLLPAAAAAALVANGRERALLRRVVLGVQPRDAAASEVHVASDAIVERVVVSGRGVLLARYRESALRDPHLERQGVTSVVAAPVPYAGRSAGAIVAYRRAGQPPFDDTALHQVLEAGRLLGLVLGVHEARTAHARGAARERVLASAIAQAATATDIASSLGALAHGAQAIAAAPFAALLVADDDTAHVHAASPGPIMDALHPGGAPTPIVVLEEVLDGALADGRPFAVLDARTTLARLGWPNDSARLAAGRNAAMLALPLAESGNLVGALVVLIDAGSPDSAAIGPLQVLAAHAASVVRTSRLRGDVEEAYLATVTALANALEAKHHDTHEHASATRELAMAVGRRLGLGGVALRDLGFAAALHDVGKIALPDSILEHDGPLSDEQWRVVREHTVFGERILRGTPFLSGAAGAVRSAHERWDGKGYPDGLRGDTIPLLARIVFACDTWDVMTSDRPYRTALPHGEAVRRLRAAAGSQLDPGVVRALLDVLGAAEPEESAAVRDAERRRAA